MNVQKFRAAENGRLVIIWLPIATDTFSPLLLLRSTRWAFRISGSVKVLCSDDGVVVMVGLR